MNDLHYLATMYKKNPEQTQADHDRKTENKIDKMDMKKIKTLSNQERIDGKELVLEQIRKQVTIKNLDTLKA